jgi:hypothetical protein
MSDANLSCKEEHRRDDVRAASLYGLDYAEVSDDQRTITVTFLGKAPERIEKANILLEGGQRITDVQVINLEIHRQPDPTLDDSMDVVVNKPGDFSTYTLSVVRLDGEGHPTDQPFAGFDPRYNKVNFNFKAACPSDLDCKVPHVCPPEKRVEPEINYLAKDYASFRQLILDRLALIMPGWQETHVPDLGIALVELLAYAGDYLSYYQDAVATEAYLGTARQRISVRRHVCLVDYAMHEGCNARAWVTIRTDADTLLDLSQAYFVTAFPGAPAPGVIPASALANVPAGSYEVFEPMWPRGQQLPVYVAHNEIQFYTWGDCQCCLAKGATSATLSDRWVPVPGGGGSVPGTPRITPGSQRSEGTPPGTAHGSPPGTPGTTWTFDGAPFAAAAAEAASTVPASDGPPGTVRALHLQSGDVLIFEEVIGPKTGNPADADAAHRQAVRLTRVMPAVDPLYHPADPKFGQPVVEIEWAPEDALKFPLCISAQAPPPDCSCKENISVARGNVILVDNGASGSETIGTVRTKSASEHCPEKCKPAEVEVLPELFRPVLQGIPLTFSQPIPPGACSAAEIIAQDPRQALPAIRLESIPAAPECASGAASPCQIPPLFAFGDLADPSALAVALKAGKDANAQFLLAQLKAATRQMLTVWGGSSPLPGALRVALVADLTALLETWMPLRDLLASGPDDNNFVVEMDNDGYAHLRFGDGDLGRLPMAGMAFEAHRRLGNGPSGNVGAETITYLVLRVTESGLNLLVRNPLPAVGGTAPEPLAEVKMFAPTAFRSVLERAITPDDYAALAADNARRLRERYAAVAAEPGAPDACLRTFQALQGAKARLRWNGSWYEVPVAIDPQGAQTASAALVSEITDYLQPYRRMGYDLRVAPAEYVPLDLGLLVCVLPDYFRGQVEAALLDVFSNRVLPDGSLGFFHPDNLTFGGGIYVSRIIAAAQVVPGVQNVQLTRLERFEIGEPPPGVEDVSEELPPAGVLQLGPQEIARLDNNPNFPEKGRLTLDVRGGR